MALSWNEIKSRAIEFSKEWKDDFNEHAEAKSFMDAFFNVFGIPRRRVATFEQTVKKEDGRQGFIDLLWKGTILIEFKSRGKNLEKAHSQAKEYFPGIKDSDLPKYILVCDFESFRLYDLEENTTVEFKLSDLVKNVQHFGYLLGYQKKVYKEQDPANVKAAELMTGSKKSVMSDTLWKFIWCVFCFVCLPKTRPFSINSSFRNLSNSERARTEATLRQSCRNFSRC